MAGRGSWSESDALDANQLDKHGSDGRGSCGMTQLENRQIIVVRKKWRWQLTSFQAAHNDNKDMNLCFVSQLWLWACVAPRL